MNPSEVGGAMEDSWLFRGERRITAIEGLSEDHFHPLQKAWLEEDAPQCSYCQPGTLMAAATGKRIHRQPLLPSEFA